MVTQVTRSEMKKSKATFVYPHAAAFASIAALLFLCCVVVPFLLSVGGTSNRGLNGVESIVTVY